MATTTVNTFSFLQNGGEMGELIRNFDWFNSPIGSPETWSQSLRTTVSTLLRSRFPTFLWWGPEWIQFYNDAYRPSLGRDGKHPKALGQKGQDCWPEIWTTIYPLIKGVIAGEESTWMENQLTPIYRNGALENVYWTSNYSLVLDDDSYPSGVLVTCMETSTEALAIELLRQKELSHQLAMEIGGLGSFTVNLKTGAAAYSPQIKDWFGLDEAGLPLAKILIHVHSDDQAFVDETLTQTYAGKAGGHHDITYRIAATATSGIRYLRSIGQVQFDAGMPVSLSGIIQDVTEQALSRQRIEDSQRSLLALFQESPVAIATLSASDDFRFEFVNAFYSELVDRKPEELIGKSLFDALPEIKDQGFDAILKKVVETGQSFEAKEIPAKLMRNGRLETVLVNFTYHPRRNAADTVNGILAVVMDVTEQVLARQKIEELVRQRTGELAKANNDLQITNIELQRSNAHLEEFAHAASHDLKEPIRKITFFTHQLKTQLTAHLNEANVQSFNRIENSTERMRNLIDDLLLYSHVSQRPHETEAVDLGATIQHVLEDLELDIEEKLAVVQVETLPVVQGYRRQLQQLFQNLISNALKYRKAGLPPHIDISSEETEENGKKYNAILVKDKGIGFDEQYTEKIFQMFARLHGKNEYSGTGVGLSIVKKVVENHNGFLRVESAVGEGSAFKIYLPEKVI